MIMSMMVNMNTITLTNWRRENKPRQKARFPLKILVILAMLFFTDGRAVYAEPPSSVPEHEPAVLAGPGISDLIRYAYDSNPGIRAKKYAWRSKIESYRSGSAYPDPQFMLTWFTDPIETRLGPQDWNATLSQKIPFPGKLSSKEEILTTDANIARLEFSAAVRDTIVAVKESFHELAYIRKAREITALNNGLLAQLRHRVETIGIEDRATLTDVLKAQSQEAQLRYDLLLLEELEQSETARMNALLNRDPDAAIGPMVPARHEPLDIDIKELYALALENNEEIKIAGLRAENGLLKRRLAKYEFLPDFKLGVFYAEIGEPEAMTPPPDAGRDAVGIQFGIDIPLWFGGKRGAVGKADADAKGAGAMQEQIRNQTMAMIRESMFRLNNAARLMTLYASELLPQAVRTLETAETWERSGQGSFSDLIEAQSTVYNFQLSLARAGADYGKYLARLEKLTGVNLPEGTNEPSREGGGR